MDRTYELRTYHANPGKLDALEERFAEHTVRLFSRHGLRVDGFFRAADEADVIVYLLSAPSREEFTRSWEAFQADPEWIAARAQSELDGKLVSRIESRFLHPTELSPLR